MKKKEVTSKLLKLGFLSESIINKLSLSECYAILVFANALEQGESSFDPRLIKEIPFLATLPIGKTWKFI